MKKSVFISLLIFTLIFSFSSLGLANTIEDVDHILTQFEGDWSSLLGSYFLTIAPLEGKEDRFEIKLSLVSSPQKDPIFVGEVELTDEARGIFDYTFNPKEEAKYTGGTIKFINKSIEISYLDKENEKHVLIFNKQAKLNEGKR